ncbi:sugar kinase [Shewanella electrodiphila]|uniref:Sugar kinase n=1 Tax=Shewanella electrodiphila TaxID=934143 RepID=A0ABT0KQI9_9GAMM|nr:sugar kinase [Shewanella electrodiphila]MCL1046028.1 sugar kinase [Shewanella electrodiphila]
MKSILAIGECMMELIEKSDSLLNRSFAGDTYNALVYAKRYNSETDCRYFTAVGDDATSITMLSEWKKHNLNTDCALISTSATIGIYAISTDDTGERSFSYWRSQSAATQMMRLKPLPELINQIGHADIAFFSGISLGILSDEDKGLLLELTKRLQENGTKIAFDPNYRPAMWNGPEHAIHWLELAYQHCDIALPGIEEHELLLGHTSPIKIMQYCQSLGAKEIIVKCGNDGTFVYECGELIAHQAFVAAPVQIDSTAAGDSFAGTYLAARNIGCDIETALIDACSVAREVVQHKGAILDIDVYAAINTYAKRNQLLI